MIASLWTKNHAHSKEVRHIALDGIGDGALEGEVRFDGRGTLSFLHQQSNGQTGPRRYQGFFE